MKTIVNVRIFKNTKRGTSKTVRLRFGATPS
jgi:hypothetical protein